MLLYNHMENFFEQDSFETNKSPEFFLNEMKDTTPELPEEVQGVDDITNLFVEESLKDNPEV